MLTGGEAYRWQKANVSESATYFAGHSTISFQKIHV
jgi:hypothetical protein